MTLFKKVGKSTSSGIQLALINSLFANSNNVYITKKELLEVLDIVLPKETPVNLTDGATITWDTSKGYNGIVTINGNRQLSMTNLVSGRYYTLIVYQGVGGNHTLTLPVGTVVGNDGNGAISLSTVAGDKDIITFYYDGTELNANYTPKFT